MSKNVLLHLSKNDEWKTPVKIINLFGKFDYDPATTEEQAKKHEINVFDTISTNGLKRNWDKFNKIWINPPFSNKETFLKKAVETYQRSRNNIYILLPLSYLGTKKFHQIVKNCTVYLFSKRIQFEGEGDRCPFSSCVINLTDEKKWEVIDE